MAVVTITTISSQASIPAPADTVLTLSNGGILLAVNATWLGTELVDNTDAGTANELFKPGDIAFAVKSGGASLMSVEAADQSIIVQGGSFSYQHPEYDSLRGCDFTHFLRPGSQGQGVVGIGGTVTVETTYDPTPYIAAGTTPGKHRAQYDFEFLLFE